MQNSATEKILQLVEQSRERAKRAEQKHENASARIQRKASRDIDLFGGSALGDIADIASDVRRASDDLYSALQMEIQLLDSDCRPLLSQQPALSAVREVCKLIKWLNEESEIENNFTASLNHQGLGQMATQRYSPTMENKMIQRFWEAKYDSWPGRAEEIAAEKERIRVRQEQERIRQEQIKAQKEEEARRKKAEEDAQRNAISQRIARKKQELTGRITELEKKRAGTKAEMETEIAREKEHLASLQSERDQLGFFQLKEKKALAQQIAQSNERIRSRTENMERTVDEMMAQIETLKGKATSLSPKVRDTYLFGTQYHSSREPMQWVVASNDGREIKLVAKHTVALLSYGRAIKWMNDEFMKQVFSPEERNALLIVERDGIREKVVHPLSSEVSAACGTLGTSPEDGLVSYIIQERRSEGRRYNYNALQIENSIKSHIEDASPYWLSTNSRERSGFANYVGKAVAGGWISARIGACASFGVRPMICISVEKLLDTL